jgi:hypothetical protein
MLQEFEKERNPVASINVHLAIR